MNLPDSIKELTQEKQADNFITPPVKPQTNINDIILSIRQNIPPEYLKNFEEGLIYYKSSASTRTFIAGLLSLYSEITLRDIKASNIDNKNEICDIVAQNIKIIHQIFDQQYKLINFLNKTDKNIDANKFSFIILGYAIETIKKIYNTKT